MKKSVLTKSMKSYINKKIGYDVFDENLVYPCDTIEIDKDYRIIDIYSGTVNLGLVRY